MGKKSDSFGQKKEYVSWTTSMDALFIEAMLYEQNQGNRPDGTFTTVAYNNMLKFLHEKLELPDLKKDHLKNRLKTLKENFAECYDLFNPLRNFGFARNPVTKLWKAEEEVWMDLIAAKPAAGKWMNKQIHNYDSMEQLFAKDRAKGECAETAKKKRKQWATFYENNMTVEEIDHLVSENLVSLDNFVNLDGMQETTGPTNDGQYNSGATSTFKKKKVSNDSTENSCLVAIEKFANIINDGNRELINAFSKVISSTQQLVYSPSEIYAELLQMNLEQPFLDKAYFWLRDNEKMTKMLFGLPLERRKNVLENMMNMCT